MTRPRGKHLPAGQSPAHRIRESTLASPLLVPHYYEPERKRIYTKLADHLYTIGGLVCTTTTSGVPTTPRRVPAAVRSTRHAMFTTRQTRCKSVRPKLDHCASCTNLCHAFQHVDHRYPLSTRIRKVEYCFDLFASLRSRVSS